MKKLLKTLKTRLKIIEINIDTRKAVYEQSTQSWKERKGEEYQEQTIDLIDIKQDLSETIVKIEFYINEHL